jgi:hypothetical protein
MLHLLHLLHLLLHLLHPRCTTLQCAAVQLNNTSA